MQTEVEEKDQKLTEQAVKGNSHWSCHEKVQEWERLVDCR